jgi:hypothetical protein
MVFSVEVLDNPGFELFEYFIGEIMLLVSGASQLSKTIS